MHGVHYEATSSVSQVICYLFSMSSRSDPLHKIFRPNYMQCNKYQNIKSIITCVSYCRVKQRPLIFVYVHEFIQQLEYQSYIYTPTIHKVIDIPYQYIVLKLVWCPTILYNISAVLLSILFVATYLALYGSIAIKYT